MLVCIKYIDVPFYAHAFPESPVYTDDSVIVGKILMEPL